MLTSETKRHIDAARQVLVGVVPNPTSQIDQITNALIYKFMDDMDQSAIKAGGSPTFFTSELEKYAWTRLMDTRLGNQERMNLYSEALIKFSEAKQLPELFRSIFKSAFLPYRSPETLGLFLKEIDYFDYTHPEELGNAYEYLLSIMSSQGDAGQFRTPRHIIDFIVDVVNPSKDDKVLDPACGTGGFLVSAYNHILEQHDGVDENGRRNNEKPLTPDDRRKLFQNFEGYDIDPGMVRIAQVNMYLHQFKNPKIYQYDSLSMDERWNDKFDVILANPPFMSPRGGIRPHNRFSVQSTRSEVLFVDYIMNHLKPNGRAGVIVPEGIIFQSGTAYKQLRKNLVEDGLYAVVSLPSGVFQPYSGVKTSILFFDNAIARQRSEILFVNVTNTGVSLGATNQLIKENDLPQAVIDINNFTNLKEVKTSISFTTSKKELLDNDADLSFSKYKPIVTLDSTVKIVQLKDIANLTKGKSSSTKTPPGDYPLFVTAEDQKTAENFDFDGDGVAVPLISALGHGKAEIKRIHRVRGKFALANLLTFVEPDRDFCNPDFLYYYLDKRKKDMARLMKGAANVSMKVSDLKDFKIHLPPLEIQEQIVAELDGYNAIIDGAKQIAENWKPKIDIDPEWEKVKLEDVIDIYNGSTPKRTESLYWEKGTIPWFTIQDIRTQGRFITKTQQHITEKGFKESSVKLLPKETVLLCCTASIGEFAFSEIELTTNQQFNGLVVKEKNKLNPKYLFWYSSLFKGELERMSGKATFGFVSVSTLKNFEIPLPSLDIQKKIVEEIEAERELVESAKKLIGIYEEKSKETIEKLWSE